MQNAGRITLTTHNTEHTTASCESFQNDSEDAKSNSTLQWPLGRWGVGWDMILQSQLSSKTAATPSPQAGGFFPIEFAAASVTDPNRVV